MPTVRALPLLVIVCYCAASAHAQNWSQHTLPFEPGSWKDISALAVDKEGNIYVGTSEDGLFISSDGGSSWRKSDTAICYRTIFIDDSSGTIYTYHASYCNFCATGAPFGGEFRYSTDNGRTWHLPDMGWPYRGAHSFTLTKNGAIYAAAWKDRILRSTDGGRNWRDMGIADLSATKRYAYISELEAHPDGEVFGVISHETIFCFSAENGRWKGILFPFTEKSIRDMVIDSNGVIYVGMEGYENDKQLPQTPIYYSTDKGQTWLKHTPIPRHTSSYRMASPAAGVLFVNMYDSILVFEDKWRYIGNYSRNRPGLANGSWCFDKDNRLYIGGHGMVQITKEPIVRTGNHSKK